jgi:hypothetical protein
MEIKEKCESGMGLVEAIDSILEERELEAGFSV